MVLEAMADGVQANIMPIGNLRNRLCDGVFQKNHELNATAQRIKMRGGNLRRLMKR